MEKCEAAKFAKLLTGLGETYNKKITSALMDIYFETLSDYTLEELNMASRKHMLDDKHGTFFPKPADFVRHIEKKTELTTEDKREFAWAEIMHQMKTRGHNRDLKLDDQYALAAVRALGGWKHLCSQTYEQLVWTKKEFFSAYESLDNTPVELLPKSLPGLESISRDHKALTS